MTIEKQVQNDSYFARGRVFTPRQISIIGEIVDSHFDEGRTKISQRICKEFKWKQPNGKLKEVACREVLRKLHDDGIIELPPPHGQGAVWNNAINLEEYRGKTTKISTLNFNNVNLKIANDQEESKLWNQLVAIYHYLQSPRIVGRQIKYIVYADDRPISCIGWGESSWSIMARDNWIGWTPKQKSRKRHLVINNVRFLILPWVRVENLASHLLAKCTRIVADDWNAIYGYRPVLLETFVDVQLFAGTCYRAANWIELGLTSGYAKAGSSHYNSQNPKAVFVFPLNSNCRRILQGRRK